MAEIHRMRALSIYDDDINAFSFQYNDGRQRFYFLVQYTNSKAGVVEDGVRRPPTYDVLISGIGKIDYGSGTAMRPVTDIEAVKSDIAEYFRTHALDTAKTPPSRTVFE